MNDPVGITCALCRLLTLQAIEGLRDYLAAMSALEERAMTGDPSQLD